MINYTFNNSIKKNQSIIDFLNKTKDIKNFVCLPDFSVKEKYKNLGYKIDFPSSIAIVTNKNNLYPQLNARGINCGMSLMKFSLQSEAGIERIKKVLININKGFFYNLFYKYHLPVFAKYNLNGDDIKKVSKQGIDFLINKYNLNSDIKKVFEENGRCELNFTFTENKFISKK